MWTGVFSIAFVIAIAIALSVAALLMQSDRIRYDAGTGDGRPPRPLIPC
jgi:hypothetical protein